MPLASRRRRPSLASAAAQSPESRAESSVNVSGWGAAAPAGRHWEQTAPPAAMASARCGPGSPQRAQSVKLGAQPATASERSRNASSTSPGSRLPSARVRSPPASSRNSCSAGSRSVSVSRSAVSSIAVPAV